MRGEPGAEGAEVTTICACVCACASTEPCLHVCRLPHLPLVLVYAPAGPDQLFVSQEQLGQCQAPHQLRQHLIGSHLGAAWTFEPQGWAQLLTPVGLLLESEDAQLRRCKGLSDCSPSPRASPALNS